MSHAPVWPEGAYVPFGHGMHGVSKSPSSSVKPALHGMQEPSACRSVPSMHVDSAMHTGQRRRQRQSRFMNCVGVSFKNKKGEGVEE